MANTGSSGRAGVDAVVPYVVPPPPLEPADPKRCQAEVSFYRPFTMGGNVRGWERCENKPHWLVNELVPGEDGQRGSMSMCDHCAAIFIDKKQLPPSAYDMEWIGENGELEVA